MRDTLLAYLCCPNCRGDIELRNISNVAFEDIIEASLFCKNCREYYEITKGIPVLLPHKISNSAERWRREKISKDIRQAIDQWHILYDAYHFRRLTHLRIKEYLAKLKVTDVTPKVLDLGISWGVNYLPFVSDIEIWGIDFSFESLLLLKEIYNRYHAPIPNLICASISAIPLKDITFELIWSTQVYQHLPDNMEVESSLAYVVGKLLKKGGILVLDSLNFHNAKILFYLKKLLQPNKYRNLEKEKFGDMFYIKYYLEKDLYHLMQKFNQNIKYKIVFTENLFHPEVKITPKSRFCSKIDFFLQRTILSKFLGRQITLIIEKNL